MNNINKLLENRIKNAFLSALTESLDFGEDNDDEHIVNPKYIKDCICERILHGEDVSVKERKLVDGYYLVRDGKALKEICNQQIKLYGNKCDLNWLDTSDVTDMHCMFCWMNSFNGDISGWDVSNVTDMNNMFHWTESFNGDLSGWDVSNVRTMHNMFCGAESFNGDLSGWDVSNVTDMSWMFWCAESFNGDLSGWDVSNVTNMSYMFDRCPLVRRKKLQPKFK